MVTFRGWLSVTAFPIFSWWFWWPLVRMAVEGKASWPVSWPLLVTEAPTSCMMSWRIWTCVAIGISTMRQDASAKHVTADKILYEYTVRQCKTIKHDLSWLIHLYNVIYLSNNIEQPMMSSTRPHCITEEITTSYLRAGLTLSPR